MARTLGSLGVAGLILAALAPTSNETQPRDKTVKYACVIFVHNVNHTVFEGRIRRAQFTKWFKKDYTVRGERIEIPAEAAVFGTLVLTDGEEILVMPLYTWGKGKAASFACQSSTIGKAPMFMVVQDSKERFLAAMKSKLATLSKEKA